MQIDVYFTLLYQACPFIADAADAADATVCRRHLANTIE